MRIRRLFVVLILILLGLYISNIVRIIINNISNVNNNSGGYSYKIIKERLSSKKDNIIVIDPGHGGRDPGKIGVNNCLEKDINLAIAIKLKKRLIESGFSVIMTRTKDVGLYNEFDVNKKNADLRNRVNIINDSEALAVISIHQNAFTSNKEKGAQVFYLVDSEIGCDLARYIQEGMKVYYDRENKRMEKSNSSYYLLKKTNKPTILIECGFLSNIEEANKLIKSEYQESIAKAINNGVIAWANNILESVY